MAFSESEPPTEMLPGEPRRTTKEGWLRLRPDDSICDLIRFAREIGSNDAACVPAASIVIDDRLAGLCTPDACPFYGRSAGCPPHAGGADAFRALLAGFREAVVIQLEVPAEILRSGRCEDDFRRLHRIAARIERRAMASGFARAAAFAGGSCKSLFCQAEADCPVLTGGPCRHPDSARPSMSGYGIDVTRLMAAAGWAFSPVTAETAPEAILSICALVLVG